MRAASLALVALCAGCLRPTAVEAIPIESGQQSLLLVIRHARGVVAEAMDLEDFGGALEWSLPGEPQLYALLYTATLGELEVSAGRIEVTANRERCTDAGETIELTGPLPIASAGYRLEAGHWQPGVPADISGLGLLRRASNPCSALEPVAADLVATTTVGNVRGALLTFMGNLSRTEVVAAWPNGELLRIDRDRVELIATGLYGIVGGVPRPARAAWLIDALGVVHCWRFGVGECPAPTPALPERPLRFATLSVPDDGGPEGTLAAIDTGALYRLGPSGWQEIFRAAVPCDTGAETCSSENTCRDCRVQIARHGDKAAVVFRSSAELLIVEGGVVRPLEPPTLAGRSDDHPNVVVYDDLGRLIVGLEAGTVERLEPEGAWSTLAQISSTVDALSLAGDHVYASGNRAQVVESFESAGLGRRWCGAQTTRGMDEVLALLPLGPGLVALGDGRSDLNYLVPANRPGPGCPDVVP